MICGGYQSVFGGEVLTRRTSCRMCAASCAYQSGKVSLSPTVISTPYGSTELRRSAAKSRVSVCPFRGAEVQLANSGMSAKARIGEVNRHPCFVGMTTVSSPSLMRLVPKKDARDSQIKTRPSAAHTPHAEKLQRKK